MRTYLFPSHRVLQEREMHKSTKTPERLEVCQLRKVILREHDGGNVRQRRRKSRLDLREAIAREEKRVQTWRYGEVGERR